MYFYKLVRVRLLYFLCVYSKDVSHPLVFSLINGGKYNNTIVTTAHLCGIEIFEKKCLSSALDIIFVKKKFQSRKNAL